MKSPRLLMCLILASFAAFLFVQDRTRQLPNTSAPPPSAAAAKKKSNLLIKPSFRISETSTLQGDRSTGSAEAAYNPDDNEFLVVWESDGLTEVTGVNDIYGQRLNGATNERIGTAFRISNLTDSDKNHKSNDPRIVYNQTAHEYLVVWNGSGLFNSRDDFFEIYGQRLSRTGKDLGRNFRISHTTDLGKVNTSFVRSNSQAKVVWNSANNEYFVIWKGMGEPQDVVKMEIYGQRLRPNGELLGKSFRISHTTDQGVNFHANAPAIAYNTRDNQYLVVWSGGFRNETQIEVWGIGLSAAGDALGQKNDFPISQLSTNLGPNARAGFPQVVYNSVDNEYLVIFQTNVSGTDNNANVYEIFGQRIDGKTFAENGANDFRISSTGETRRRASRPAVIFNSVVKEYLVIWRETLQNGPAEVSGQRMTSDAAVIEAAFQISSITSIGRDRSVNNCSLTQNTRNGDYLVVWQGNGLPGVNSAKITEIFGQRLALSESDRL